MNVVHLLGCPIESGAGRGVFALHAKLRELDCNSIILGRVAQAPEDSVGIRGASTLSKIPSGILSRYKRIRLEREVGKVPSKLGAIATILHVTCATGRKVAPTSEWPHVS